MSHSGLDLVTPRVVEAAHRRGLKVLPWTIDKLDELKLCGRAGVDGLNTNRPGLMQ